MSCINRQVGKSPVEPGFARVTGRPQWAIPWLEDDPNMVSPQLWVGRMRRDAFDALRYGCTGLMGIHWRTRVLGPNVAALARAGWDQAGWSEAATSLVGTASEEGAVGGKTASYPDADIAGTDDDPLYRTVRYDMSAYRLKLPDGRYNIVLSGTQRFRILEGGHLAPLGLGALVKALAHRFELRDVGSIELRNVRHDVPGVGHVGRGGTADVG